MRRAPPAEGEAEEEEEGEGEGVGGGMEEGNVLGRAARVARQEKLPDRRAITLP